MGTSRSDKPNYTLEDIYSDLARPHEGQGACQILRTLGLQSYPVDATLPSINAHIAYLIEQGFNCHYADKDGTKVLVKDNINVPYDSLNPIHPHEADIQFFRYLRGVYIIAENMNDENDKITLINDIKKMIRHYAEQTDNYRDSTYQKADLVLYLIDKLANSLACVLYPSARSVISKDHKTELKNAMKQITMARDLGILLENHSPVVTISEVQGSNIISAEKSTLTRIRQAFYHGRNSLFHGLHYQPWFASAKEFAGLAINDRKTWLDHFFDKNLTELSQKGIPVPPSARWLPLPANTQHMETLTGKRVDGRVQFTNYNDLIRTGVIIPYDIRKHYGNDKPYNYQKDIATDIIKEVIHLYLLDKITEFKKLYHISEGESFRFSIHYQTLLSPIIGESRLKHTDNNARFVALARKVIKNLNKDALFKNEFEHTGAKIKITYTNSAVNKNAVISVDNKKDEKTRREKIADFKKFHHDFMIKHGNNYVTLLTENPQLANEIVLRKAACICLENLLDREAPFDRSMENHQYNLTMAALDHLLIGSQGLSIDGCKSTRDRTAIFGCAVKTMLEQPDAMENWQALEDGIVCALRQGQYFKSMIYHSGIVKVDLVHENFMKALPPEIQASIKKLLVFSKNLSISTDTNSPPIAAKSDQDNKQRALTIGSSLSGLFPKMRSQPGTPTETPNTTPKVKSRNNHSQ